MMLIAQITDPHLGFAAGGHDEPNRRRLDAVVAAVASARPAPDLVIVTGDLTEHGDVASYRSVRDALAPIACPVHLMLGNHDRRDAFDAVWPGRLDGGFLHHVVDTPALRLALLDTLAEGRHGGGFCAARAAWLTARLGEAPDVPTLVLLHHPPVPVGIAWMDPGEDEPWVDMLAGALAGHRQVAGLLAGHLHRAIATTWRGLPVFVCPSTAPALALDLTPIDPAVPDDRAMIADTAPGYALHRWDGTRPVTHVGSVAEPVLVRYTPALQPLVGGIAAERAT